MRINVIKIVLLLVCLLVPHELRAANGYIEVTAPGNRMMRLAVDAPRSTNSSVAVEVAKEMSDVIAFDMNMTGLVSAETREKLPLPGGIMFSQTDFTPWMAAGYDLLVRSEYSIRGNDLTVEFRLFDVLNRKMLTAKRFLGNRKELRQFAHAFSDEIMRSLTGEKGCFTSRIALVMKQRRNKEIAIMDWDGHNMAMLTRNGSINLNPDISPDGREIIYTSYRRGNPDLYKRVLSINAETLLSGRRGLNITGTWSPNGTRIALAMSKDGDSEIYTIARDGSAPKRLTVGTSLEVYPAWSPDGSQIAFVSDRLGKPHIFVMDANGGNVRRLTTAGGYNVNPRWSPKGDRIAYVRMGGGSFQIYSIKLDGSEDTQLTSLGNNENPTWSPDGRFIAFSSTRTGSEAIYVMRTDGSGQIRVSRGGGSASQPSWSRN